MILFQNKITHKKENHVMISFLKKLIRSLEHFVIDSDETLSKGMKLAKNKQIKDKRN